MQKNYLPQPILFSQTDLPNEITDHIEDIARNVHEVWAAGRMAQGWIHGENRNDLLKEHPNLVPYCELPEFEKEYDRKTALATLSYIFSMRKLNLSDDIIGK